MNKMDAALALEKAEVDFWDEGVLFGRGATYNSLKKFLTRDDTERKAFGATMSEILTKLWDAHVCEGLEKETVDEVITRLNKVIKSNPTCGYAEISTELDPDIFR